LPNNQELSSGINKAQTGISRNEDQLSPTGRAVTSDINNLLETFRSMILEKNDGELMQKAYYHSHQAGGKKNFSERINHLRGTNYGSGDKNALREEARGNISSMATIIKLAFLSPEFRETINDMASISNQLLKNQEEKRGNPTAAEPATASTRDIAMEPVPQQSSMSSMPGSAHTIPVATAPLVAGTNTETRSMECNHSMNQAAPVMAPAPTSSTRDVSGVNNSAARTKMSRDEKEDLLIDRLVNLAQTLHSNPEYRNAIMYMANSASKVKSTAISKKEEGKAVRARDKATEPQSEIEHHKKEAQLNSKEFAENWIGDDYSLDRLLNQIEFLYRSSKTDPELRQLLQDWKTWSTLTIKDASYVQDKERVRSDTKDLVRRTRLMSQGPYREQFTILRREFNYINKALQRDRSVQNLRGDINQLTRDLVMDQNGNAVLKPELLGDAQKIIAGVLETVKYIPLPPIHRNNEDMELQLENIVLTATEVAPSNVRFIVQTDMEKTGAENSRQNDNSFILEISKIRAHLTSINFFVDKKTGFPKITERGLADVDLAGTNGLSLRIEIAPQVQKSGNQVHSLFEAKNVTCSIDKLKIHLRETSHDFLYKLISPVMNMVAKKKIEAGICDAIRDGVRRMNTTASSQFSESAQKTQQKIDESDRVRNEPSKMNTPAPQNPQTVNQNPKV